MRFGDILGKCCRQGGSGRLDYCSLFYAGLFSSLKTIISVLKKDFVGRVVAMARDNLYEPSSKEFWYYVYREYFYPVFMLAKVYNESRYGKCIGEIFAREFKEILLGKEYLDFAPEHIGIGLDRDISDSLPFINITATMVLSTAEGIIDGLAKIVSREAMVLLNEELLEDLVLSRDEKSMIVLRPSNLFGGLSELFLWIFASMLQKRGLVSGVFSLENFLKRRILDYSLASKNRLVLLSYDSISREYMLTTGHLPSGRFEIWVNKEGNVVSLNVFSLQSIRAADMLYRVWNSIDKYLEGIPFLIGIKTLESFVLFILEW